MSILPAEHASETFRSLVAISIEGLRTLVLLNGGAIVALIAYLGQIESRASVATGVGSSLGWFVAGLVAGVVGFFGAYLTQLSLYNESVLGSNQRHHWALWGTFAVCGFSVVAFVLGAFAIIAHFTKA
jgi:hypothetical protein